MSYNVSQWKTKKITDLVIPLSAFFQHHRKDWHPSRVNNDDGSISLIGGCDSCSIHGHIDGDDDVLILSIDCCGEGSGTFLNWILEPALKMSTGFFEAARVWEGGDDIDRITVNNGILSTVQIEL